MGSTSVPLFLLKHTIILPDSEQSPTYLRGVDSLDNQYIIAAFCEGTGRLKEQDREIKAFRRKTLAGLFPMLHSTFSLFGY